jgi:hypothetical protein
MRVIESGERDMRDVRPLGRKEFQASCCCFRLSREGGLKKGDNLICGGNQGHLTTARGLDRL